MYLPHIKAVMFDIGGVVLQSPFTAIAEYETEKGLPPQYLNVSIASRGASGAWQRFERGELPLFDFYTAFGRDLSDTTNGNIWYTEYHKRKQTVCPELPQHLHIDGRDLFGRMMQSASSYDAHMLTAIRNLRAAGKWRILALTNNFGGYHDAGVSPSREIPAAELEFLGWQDGPVPNPLRELFDFFYDSSAVGLRKPDSRFYLHACKDSGINPEQIIFLDDIGMNLKTAKQLGMTTIHVPNGGTLQAVKQLEEYLGIDLCTDITEGYRERTKL
ncbi:HAD-like protein [Boletus reticuloceps]|uniref:HAD-like protein n=1 Tax=Boletus reticuloceps TaxID=495285 RepID=A0A8I2YVC9_9AGAM|nr:HAD-like protein [Boletus reticuloceps]